MNDRPDSALDPTVKEATVTAIKAKAKALFEEREAIRDQMAELDVKLRRNEIAIFDCRGAARLFDADIELPEDLATARAVWVRRVMNETPPRPTAAGMAAAGVDTAPASRAELFRDPVQEISRRLKRRIEFQGLSQDGPGLFGLSGAQQRSGQIGAHQ